MNATKPAPAAPLRCIRYALTHVGKYGLRTLISANQGRNFHDTREDALAALASLRGHNHPTRLAEFYGSPDTLEIRPIICWNNGDACGIYFDEPWPTDERRHLEQTAGQCLYSHGLGGPPYCGDTAKERRDDENLCRANCGACVLGGYHDLDDDEHDRRDGPNYSGWARIYVEAGRTIPRKWKAAFLRELDRTDNALYLAALVRDIQTWGITFAPETVAA